MFQTKEDILSRFKEPVYTSHRVFPSLKTFNCLHNWNGKAVIELSKLRIEISDLDYLYCSSSNPFDSQLHFQQNCYRLWYQIEGNGILQNVTRNSFGTARPGLLGIMERGERHSYLHQKGNFQCFQILFSFLPSQKAKCYWNTEIEGKTVLEGSDRLYFENLLFDLLFVISNNKEILGLASISRILEILVVLFKKGLIIIDESQFPRNKTKSLIAKAKNFMSLHFNSMHHQAQLEKECGVDINYLNVIFKREIGKTLYQYITDVRMEFAKHLLETTDLSVVTIAKQVGYPNGNSFTRAFKRHEHCTPQQFRKIGSGKKPK